MPTRTAVIVGTGLIGGSIALGLRELGWKVHGVDASGDTTGHALDVGAIDQIGWPADADLTVVATPATQIHGAVTEALSRTTGAVTDVGSVKGEIAANLPDPRFVGGHPMAGSEQEGVRGARADLFNGATWVLTPTATTDDTVFATVRSAVTSLGAEVVSLDPVQHDRLVAMVSHVPHLTAATLMRLADQRSVEHRALLRLAAGGFRDMTRIASGNTGIWPDICAANSAAIVEVLDDLLSELTEMRSIVADHDSKRLLQVLGDAQTARVNLPTSAPADVDLAVVRVPIFDRPGELARITRLATDIDVNIFDLEIAHSVEGAHGVLVLVVEEKRSERLLGALMAHDYRPSVRSLPQ